MALIVLFVLGVISGRAWQNHRESSLGGETPTSGLSKKTDRSLSRNVTRSSLLPDFPLSDIKSRVREEALAPAHERNDALVKLLFSEWLEKDPIGALDFAKENDLEDLILEGLRIWGEQNPDGALAWIDSNTKDLFLRITWEESIFQGLSQSNPEEAVLRAEEITTRERKERLQLLAFEQWATQDNGKAFDWLKKQERTPFTEQLYANAVHRYIELNPEEAANFISSLKETQDSVNFANKAAYLLAEAEPEKASAWVEGLTGETKYFANMGLLESWASSPDAASALAYVGDQLDSPHGEEYFAMTSMQIARNNPDLLATELPALGEEQQIVAAGMLGQAFSSLDIGKAEAWLDTLQKGPVRDAALRSSLDQLRFADANKAFRLSETISNDDQRLAEIQRTLEVWAPTQPEAALSALDNSAAFPPELKVALRADLTRLIEESNDLLLPADSE